MVSLRQQYSHPSRNVLNMRVDFGMFRASAMDLMVVRLRNGISIILLRSTFFGLGPTLVGFREDTSKGGEFDELYLIMGTYKSPEVMSEYRSQIESLEAFSKREI